MQQGVAPQHQQLQSPEPWLVVGRGAIGLLAASYWALAQQPVQLWLRQQQPLNYRFSVARRDFPIQLAATSNGPFTKVLIPVKAYDTLTAVKQLLPHLTSTAQLVLCHNGMGTIDEALTLLGPEQGLWFASTTQGAYKPSQLQVRHTGFGETKLGACNNAAKNSKLPIAQELAIALGPLEQVSDITPYLWQKLAINSVINPLTALLQVKNGALLKAEYQPQILQLLTEFVSIANASGQQFTVEALQQLLHRVQQNTADNYSSMQQDVANQKRTELAAITGFLLKRATALEIVTPAQQALYDELCATLQPWQY